MTRPGDTLLKGRYRTTRLLHRGGFGFIYLAWDKVLGQNVVLKELIPALAGDPATLKHFIREAQATSCLAHPNIVRTLNLFTDQDNYFIVMEYLPVGSLEDLLHERERLTLDEAVLIATDICTALTEAHSYGVYHCDLALLTSRMLWWLAPVTRRMISRRARCFTCRPSNWMASAMTLVWTCTPWVWCCIRCFPASPTCLSTSETRLTLGRTTYASSATDVPGR
jgi:serine/threonine protein kinase